LIGPWAWASGDGFEHGGWASAAIGSPDPAIGEAMGARMAESDGLLLGRRTRRSGPDRGARRHRQRAVTPAMIVHRSRSASTKRSTPEPALQVISLMKSPMSFWMPD
jgi:hypothetical protein